MPDAFDDGVQLRHVLREEAKLVKHRKTNRAKLHTELLRLQQAAIEHGHDGQEHPESIAGYIDDQVFDELFDEADVKVLAQMKDVNDNFHEGRGHGDDGYDDDDEEDDED